MTRTDQASLDEIRALVCAVSGLAAIDEQTLMRAVRARLGAVRAPTIAAYVATLRAGDDGELRGLVQEMRNGETYFFRDHGQMTLLRDTLLPRLVARRRPTRSIRIWSAGCSTGEEPYSLAILLDEMLPRPETWSVHIVGTDIHAPSLEHARAGLYGANSFRPQAPLGLRARSRHFRPEGDSWRISERIRRMVKFEKHSIVRDALTPRIQGMDLVVCRNVLIYIERAAARRAVEKLASALAPDGQLIVGHTELHGRTPEVIHPVLHPESLVYERQTLKPRREPARSARAKSDGASPQRASSPGGGRAAPPPTPPLRARIAEPVARTDPREAARRAADLGLHAEAERHAAEALRANPNDIEMHRLLAHIAEELGQEGEARSRLRKVIYLAPQDIEAHLHLALFHELAGDAARARRLRATALSIAQALPPATPVEGFEALDAGRLTDRLQKMLDAPRDPEGASHA